MKRAKTNHRAAADTQTPALNRYQGNQGRA